MSEPRKKPDAPHWRDAIAADLEEQRKTGPIYGDDAEGNACRFNPDGTKDVLRSAKDVAAADATIFAPEND